ncbi:hypothetical protein RYX36_022302 [Vicia faba]
MNGGIVIYSLVWGNSLVGFCVKILNSAVVIGLYYGFLTTFSRGPFYLFLLRGKILGKGSETKISSTNSEINEISKEVPRWSYDLVDELEVLKDASPKESQIRSPKADRIVIFNSKTDSNDNKNSVEPNRNTEFVVVHYSREPGWSGLLLFPCAYFSMGGRFTGTAFVTSWYTHGLASSYLEGCNFLTPAVSTPASSYLEG